MRLFADDTSLFARVDGIDQTHEKLENDLWTMNNWIYQQKLLFNPDISKQAVEVVFSVKMNKPTHPELFFN